MSETAIIYLMLKIIEFFVFWQSGKRMSCATDSKVYWKVAVYPIVVYALIEGLRWGHLIDYNVYAERYMAVNDFLTTAEHSSPLFTIIVFSLKKMGCSFPMFLVLQCGFLMYSTLLLLQDYRKYAYWSVPCLLITLAMNENLIRFFLGLSFVYISVYFLFKNHYFKFILFGILGSLIHFGLIFVFLFFCLAKIINKKMIPSFLAAGFFVVSTFILSIKDFQFLVVCSNFITSFVGTLDYQLINYMNTMDRMLVGELGSAQGIRQVAFISQIKSVITFLPFIFLAPQWILEYKWGRFIYNSAVLGLILSPVLGSVDVLGRFCIALSIFIPIIVAGTFVNFADFHDEKKNILITLVLYLSLFLFFLFYINAPVVRKDFEMYFIWDSGGALTNWRPYAH